MKKILTIFLAVILTASLAACSSNEQKTPSTGVIDRPQQSQNTDNNQSGSNPSATDDQNNQTNTSAGSKILITYFTVPETDGVDTAGSRSK